MATQQECHALVQARLAPDAGDASFLEDLLQYFDEPQECRCDAPIQPGDETSSSHDSHSDGAVMDKQPIIDKRPLPKTCKPAGSRSDTKRTLDQLRAEASELTERLCHLRTAAAKDNGNTMELALNERTKRRRAEKECEQLRQAVYSQARFIRGLRSVFSSPPSFMSGLTTSRYLHTLTRLPRNPRTRSKEYATLSQSTRVQSAVEILMRETENVICSASSDPFVQTELVTEAEGFSTTSMSVYSLDSSDIGAVLRGRKIEDLDVVSTVSATSGSDILYRVLGVQHRSLSYDEELSLETRTITLCRQTPDYGIVVWDYVDDDELNPINPNTDITRQAIGVSLVRREMCEDGVERTVYRAINTRRYRFNSDAPQEPSKHFYDTIGGGINSNEMLFRKIILEEVAKEQVAYQRAMRVLSTS